MPKCGTICCRLAIAAAALTALALCSCRTSSLVEDLHAPSGTRIFWHPQGDLTVAIGFRERDDKATEMVVIVRNDGELSTSLPALDSTSVQFFVDGTAVAGRDAAGGEAVTLAPGQSTSYMIPHKFAAGKSHRVFAAVSAPGSGLPRRRAVSPEILVSALFGAPPKYQPSRWLEQ